MANPKPRDLRYFPEWLHHELLNWSRWCWLGPWPHPLPPNQCGSVERDYARFRVSDSADEPQPVPPNEARALIVDGVWRGLPPTPRQVLRAEYPQYRDSGRAEFGRVGAARRMGMRLREYEDALGVAISRVWNTFEGRR
jgi:hypothetical protein